MKLAVPYTRVSTVEQGKSGLGLEAQQAAVEAFAAREGFTLTELYTEVESGKYSGITIGERPVLAAAIAKAQKLKATIIVSKLDRLSRDVEFIAGLMKSNVQFMVAELGPNVSSFMLHIYAAVAEEERKVIVGRIRAAFAAKKARRERCGSLDMARVRAVRDAAVRVRDKTAEYALVCAVEAGKTSLRAIADCMNDQGSTTSTGGAWTAEAVRRLKRRILNNVGDKDEQA